MDDHPLFRQGVVDSLSLEPGIRVVGQAATGEEALKLIHALYPQVAIVDINLPGINGQQVTHQVISEKVPTRIVLLTGYDDSEQILHAAIAGAAGYCAKDIEPRHLTTVVKHVAQFFQLMLAIDKALDIRNRTGDCTACLDRRILVPGQFPEDR